MDPPLPRCAVHVLSRHSRDTRAAAKGGFLWMAAAAAHVHLTSIPTRPLPLTSISRPFRHGRCRSRPSHVHSDSRAGQTGASCPFKRCRGPALGLASPQWAWLLRYSHVYSEAYQIQPRPLPASAFPVLRRAMYPASKRDPRRGIMMVCPRAAQRH
jgi:hypothetical protein